MRLSEPQKTRRKPPALKGMAAGAALAAEIKAASLAIDMDSAFNGEDVIMRLSSQLEDALNKSGFGSTFSDSSMNNLASWEALKSQMDDSEGGYFAFVAQNCISQAEEYVEDADTVLSRKKANMSSMVFTIPIDTSDLTRTFISFILHSGVSARNEFQNSSQFHFNYDFEVIWKNNIENDSRVD